MKLDLAFREIWGDRKENEKFKVETKVFMKSNSKSKNYVNQKFSALEEENLLEKLQYFGVKSMNGTSKFFEKNDLQTKDWEESITCFRKAEDVAR